MYEYTDKTEKSEPLFASEVIDYLNGDDVPDLDVGIQIEVIQGDLLLTYTIINLYYDEDRDKVIADVELLSAKGKTNTTE